MEIINWKELLYPYEQAVEELLLKFKNLDKECRHLGIYSPVDSVTGRLKTPASILDKAGRKHIAPDHIEEEIENIAGDCRHLGRDFLNFPYFTGFSAH